MKRRLPPLAALLCLAALSATASDRPFEPKSKPDIEMATSSSAPGGRSGAFSLSAGSSHDTVWYGGTYWAPDSMRWEALRDSVWTFDTGVGSSINTGGNVNKPIGYHQTMEGWVGIDWSLGGQIDQGQFRRSSTCAIGGSWSMWAGLPQSAAQARCFAAGQGYGNSLNTCLYKSFSYPGSGDVTLTFDYAVETEPGFDYAYVLVDTTGNLPDPLYSVALGSWTGTQSGTGVFVLHPGTTLPRTAKPVTILFKATSDGSYSDEDGLFPTVCGHTAVDNVALSGAITDFTDFESDAGGWATYVRTRGLGDFSSLDALSDLPPPDTSGPCAIQDSVLVFYDLQQQHPLFQSNIALSPWIDLKRGGDDGRPGRIVRYDLYCDMPIEQCTYVTLRARWKPADCPYGGEFRDQNVFYWFGDQPFCSPPGTPIQRDYSDVIDAGAEQIQFAIGIEHIFSYNPFCTFTPNPTNSTPYIDNIRFGVYGSPTSAAPEPGDGPSLRPSLSAARPNPSIGRTTIAFVNPEENGRVTIQVFDVTGRLVKTLADAPMTAGRHEAAWDGTNASGAPAASGLYFYRMTSGGWSDAKQLVLIR